MLDFYKGCRPTLQYLRPTWHIHKDKDPFQWGILSLKNYNSRGRNHKNRGIRERLVLEDILYIIYLQPTCRGEGCHPLGHEQREEKAEHKKTMKP